MKIEIEWKEKKWNETLFFWVEKVLNVEWIHYQIEAKIPFFVNNSNEKNMFCLLCC